MSDILEEVVVSDDRRGKIPIVELFGPTLQGEGAVAGQVSFFVRTGYCSYECSWCDSMHAVDPARVQESARWLTSAEVVRELRSLHDPRARRKVWVTLTGGDPVLWDLEEVVSQLLVGQHKIAVETQGRLWKDWLEICDLVTVSPKPPSSGMADRLSVASLQKYHARLPGRLVLKVVVFNDDDLEFAARMRRILPDVPFYLSAGTPKSKPADPPSRIKLDVCTNFKVLAEKVCADPRFHDAIVLPQLHVLAWSTDLGR